MYEDEDSLLGCNASAASTRHGFTRSETPQKGNFTLVIDP